MTSEAKAGLLTKAVLKSIAYHLSSRQDCKGIEYTVTIRADEADGCDIVTVSPYITVFPNIHNRKETDRRSIAYHVISKHFPELLIQSNSKSVQVLPNQLVHGSYTYKTYKLTPRRKWRRVKDLEVSDGSNMGQSENS